MTDITPSADMDDQITGGSDPLADRFDTRCDDCAAQRHSCSESPDDCDGPFEKVCGGCAEWDGEILEGCWRLESPVLADRMTVNATTDASDCEGWEER